MDGKRSQCLTVMVMISDVSSPPSSGGGPLDSCRSLRLAWSLNDRFADCDALFARSREAIERENIVDGLSVDDEAS